MTWKRNVLVLANVTATSEELLSDLRTRAGRQPTMFTLVVPATPFRGGREAAIAQLDEATQQLLSEGLDVSGSVGDGDPIIAVTDDLEPQALRRDRRLDAPDAILEVAPCRTSRADRADHRCARLARRLPAPQAGAANEPGAGACRSEHGTWPAVGARLGRSEALSLGPLPALR